MDLSGSSRDSEKSLDFVIFWGWIKSFLINGCGGTLYKVKKKKKINKWRGMDTIV